MDSHLLTFDEVAKRGERRALVTTCLGYVISSRDHAFVLSQAEYRYFEGLEVAITSKRPIPQKVLDDNKGLVAKMIGRGHKPVVMTEDQPSEVNEEESALEVA